MSQQTHFDCSVTKWSRRVEGNWVNYNVRSTNKFWNVFGYKSTYLSPTSWHKKWSLAGRFLFSELLGWFWIRPQWISESVCVCSVQWCRVKCVDWPVWTRSNPYGVISALWGRLLCPPRMKTLFPPRPAAINHRSSLVNTQSMALNKHTHIYTVCLWAHPNEITGRLPYKNTKLLFLHLLPQTSISLFVSFSLSLNVLTNLLKQKAHIMSSHQPAVLINWASNKNQANSQYHVTTESALGFLLGGARGGWIMGSIVHEEIVVIKETWKTF